MRELTQTRKSNDRVGLGWRPELAAGILTHLDQIDLVEVIVDGYFHASKADLRALSTLRQHVEVIYHGVTLGLASSFPVDSGRLEKLARVLGQLEPAGWSEHLAFVRAGGVEIGHLAAPPRTEQMVEAACRNLDRVTRLVGSRPALENIATLMQPPGSDMSEASWVTAVVNESASPFLLDLHNHYANCLNFGLDPFQSLLELPLNRIKTIHLSGGHWIANPSVLEPSMASHRLLDDHVHDVPDAVFELLKQVASICPQPLSVIIERDGNYPQMQSLLNQLASAREALALGRAQRTELDSPHRKESRYEPASL